MVSSSFGYDVNQRVGIQKAAGSNYTILSEGISGKAPKVGPAAITKTKPNWNINTMNLIKILAREEGFSNKPYLCDAGYVTIGLGTKLHKQKGQEPEDFPISVNREVAEIWLDSEVALKHSRLSKSKFGKIYEQLNDQRQAIILSMAYQMGTSGLLKFRNTWDYLAIGMFYEASVEMLDSEWARETSPLRAKRHSRVIAGESLERVYGED